jgi:hypothetical protein
MQFSLVSCWFVRPKPKYFPQQPTPEHPQPVFFRNMRDQLSHPHKTTRKIIFMDTVFLHILEKIHKTRDSRPNSTKNSLHFVSSWMYKSFYLYKAQWLLWLSALALNIAHCHKM